MKEKIKGKKAERAKRMKRLEMNSPKLRSDSRRKVSEMTELEFYKMRKWSVEETEFETTEIPKEKKKYILRSMKEFRQVTCE